MKSPRVVRSIRVGLLGSIGVLVLTFGACDKSNPASSRVETKTTSKPSSADDAKKKRLAWNLETLVVAYDQAGRKKSTWDKPAKAALTEFARLRSQSVESNEPAIKILSTNCDLAIAAGCDDPMISYLHARFSLTRTNNLVIGSALSMVADELEGGRYPAIRKFYASLRAAVEQKAVVGGRKATTTPPEVHKYRRQAVSNLIAALADKTMPIGEVDEACHQMLSALENNQTQYEWCWHLMEERLSANWPEDSAIWLLKGRAYTKLAWFARGGGYANTVSDEQWRLFGEKLAVAQQTLETAWQKNPSDPRIACRMITIELGQGKGRERMELWFQRAMALDPNCYDACDAKRYYLEPKWHGSPELMLAFARECVSNKAWGGHVPLVMIDAHEALAGYLDKSQQAAYWKRSGVWRDIKAALERFFELEPDATGWRHNYAKYAYLCEQWEDLNEQLALLGPVNYDYFGGKAEFDKMVGLAKQHTKK